MTHLLIGSGLVDPSKPILNSLLENNPPAQIAESLINSCRKDRNFCSQDASAVFDCVIDWYCEKGLCIQALEVFNLTRDFTTYSIRSYHTLLTALYETDEAKLALCFYGFMIRNGVSVDRFALRVIAKIFSKQGKINAMLRLISINTSDPLIYDLVIDRCSELGMLEHALHMFDEMSERKLNPGFNNFASVLNGACRYKNDEMIEFAMESMAEKGYVSKPLTKHDSLIQKLCDLRKAYAAYMLFKTACDSQQSLKNRTYGCMIRALSMEARVKEAIEIHHIIEHKSVQVNPVFYNEFINILCNENASKEVDSLLKDLISKGFKPGPNTISKFITALCKTHRWKEAEELAELAMQESILLESSCCGLLMKRYCRKRQIDLAVNLHDQMEKNDYYADSMACNALINGLLEVVRVKEAEKIFDYMRMKNLLTGETFVIMINGFCRENELKKAMKLHDEMLAMGLKPSPKVYRRLICNFK
ncbi:pentatricopeptide repeat-containing protein At4g21170-like [Bidens hawaiensis]|uniref:pentatricopeptide repeat-containing protein At4g21170-like n=1 Tax=Bidens hawaiensis TaxID=980011 RepID=UPI00404B293C